VFDLSPYFKLISSRGRLLALMNFVFFASVFAVAIASELLLPPRLYSGWQARFPEIIIGNNFLIVLLGIFLSNLVLSAFVVVTLPGFVFFPISIAMLLFRGFLWGVFLAFQPTWLLLAAIPTVVLEGEGYALAAVAGTVVGVSWLKSKWIFNDENITRVEAFQKGLKECLVIYLLVGTILLVAAIIETVTLEMVIR